MLEILSPFVYWAQDKENVYLKIDIQKAKDVNVQVLDKGKLIDVTALTFEDQRYQFSLNLADKIEKNVCKKINDLKVDLVLSKTHNNHPFWDSLIEKTHQKTPAWLKVDFDRWKFDESSDEEVEKRRFSEDDYFKDMWNKINDKNNKNVMSQEDILKKINMLTCTYLFAYNTCMFMAHFYVLVLLMLGYFLHRDSDYLEKYWSNKFSSFVTCTLLQYLDVFNCLVGLTKSRWQTTVLQVTGRLGVLYIIDGNPEIHSWLPVYILLVVYFIGEQFRYPYYALNSLSVSFYLITWLRYSHFLLFYPIGFSMEALIFLRSIPFYYSSGIYGIQLPNSLNISFNFGIILAIMTFSLFPYAAFSLFGHMKRQRAKKLNKSVSYLNAYKKLS